MFFTGKIIYLYLKIKTRIWHNIQKKFTKIGKDTNFLLESKIENISLNPDNLIVGNCSNIRGNLFVFPHGGKISIGDYCYIAEGTRIWSAKKISIGNRVLIAHNVDIHDSNDHPISTQERHEHYVSIISKGHPKNIANISSEEIVIEDDVWIGFGATILKGVVIGKGSIIAARTILTKSVPPNSVVYNNSEITLKKVE